ncbi:MAG: hypothetical protein NZO16_04590, partial [Deltaproteobacteria bacterium]|nr:hypothetical protein [Deltaproteobacteria bacterium]
NLFFLKTVSCEIGVVLINTVKYFNYKLHTRSLIVFHVLLTSVKSFERLEISSLLNILEFNR